MIYIPIIYAKLAWDSVVDADALRNRYLIDTFFGRHCRPFLADPDGYTLRVTIARGVISYALLREVPIGEFK